MDRLFRVLVVVAVAAPAALGWGAGPAHAHGQREVNGISWTVGWAEEPAFVGFRNAVQLFLVRPGTEEPVEGAEETLEVEVGLGDETTERMPLRAVFDSPGEYRADLMPTAPGGYTFRFVGEVAGESVDESWTSPEDGFDVVEGTSQIAFPNPAPANAELAERIDAVEETAQDARDGLTLPRILGVAGVVLGLVALVLAVRPRGTRA